MKKREIVLDYWDNLLKHIRIFKGNYSFDILCDIYDTKIEDEYILNINNVTNYIKNLISFELTEYLNFKRMYRIKNWNVSGNNKKIFIENIPNDLFEKVCNELYKKSFIFTKKSDPNKKIFKYKDEDLEFGITKVNSIPSDNSKFYMKQSTKDILNILFKMKEGEILKINIENNDIEKKKYIRKKRSVLARYQNNVLGFKFEIAERNNNFYLRKLNKQNKKSLKIINKILK